MTNKLGIYLTLIFFVIVIVGCKKMKQPYSNYESAINELNLPKNHYGVNELRRCINNWDKSMYANIPKNINTVSMTRFIFIEIGNPNYGGYEFVLLINDGKKINVYTDLFDGVNKEYLVTDFSSKEFQIFRWLDSISNDSISGYASTTIDDGSCFFVTIKNGSTKKTYALYDILAKDESDDENNLKKLIFFILSQIQLIQAETVN